MLLNLYFFFTRLVSSVSSPAQVIRLFINSANFIVATQITLSAPP